MIPAIPWRVWIQIPSCLDSWALGSCWSSSQVISLKDAHHISTKRNWETIGNHAFVQVLLDTSTTMYHSWPRFFPWLCIFSPFSPCTSPELATPWRNTTMVAKDTLGRWTPSISVRKGTSTEQGRFERWACNWIWVVLMANNVSRDTSMYRYTHYRRLWTCLDNKGETLRIVDGCV